MVSDAAAPDPKISSWAVIASMSLKHVAPAASEHAASTNARPRWRSGTNPDRAITAARSVHNPSRSASNRGSTTPAAATVPAPPTWTDNLSDHPSAGSTTA